MIKYCSRCQEHKPYEEFNKNRRTNDGFEYYCRDCKRLIHKQLKEKCCLYTVVHNAKNRCNNSSHSSYNVYGGRGITYDHTFNDYKTFWKHYGPIYEDAQKKYPGQKLTIDRIDTNGNYELGNIRFLPIKENSNNRRTNVLITYKDEMLTATQWSEKTGIPIDTILSRKHNNWPDELIVTMPHPLGRKASKCLTVYFKNLS